MYDLEIERRQAQDAPALDWRLDGASMKAGGARILTGSENVRHIQAAFDTQFSDPLQALPRVGVVGMPFPVRNLRLAGFDCQFLSVDAVGRSPAALLEVDLWVIEWDAIRTSAVDLLERIRTCARWTPVIAVLGRYDEREIIRATNVGADMCMTEASSSLELRARAQALLTRHRPHFAVGGSAGHPLEVYGNISFNVALQAAYLDEEEVSMPRREYLLARLLLRNIGQIFSKSDLTSAIWPGPRKCESRHLAVLVSRIRIHLGLTSANGWNLASVRGVGYCLRRVSGTALKGRAI